jgi:hypothetical protein
VVTCDSNTATSTTDKTILRHVFHKSFTIRFPHRNGRKEVPRLSKRGDSSGIQMGSRQMTTLELDGMGMACSEGSALAQRSTPQYFRRKYTLSRHVVMRILKGACGKGTFIFSDQST